MGRVEQWVGGVQDLKSKEQGNKSGTQTQDFRTRGDLSTRKLSCSAFFFPFIPWRWSNTGAGCPERLWNLSVEMVKTQPDSPGQPAQRGSAWEEGWTRQFQEVHSHLNSSVIEICSSEWFAWVFFVLVYEVQCVVLGDSIVKSLKRKNPPLLLEHRHKSLILLSQV